MHTHTHTEPLFPLPFTVRGARVKKRAKTLKIRPPFSRRQVSVRFAPRNSSLGRQVLMFYARSSTKSHTFDS